MVKEQTFGEVDDLAEAFESIVDELEFNGLKYGSFKTAGFLAYQAVGEYLDQVNWDEIAEHYAADFDLFCPEDEEAAV
jgi:hypothetical protein